MYTTSGLYPPKFAVKIGRKFPLLYFRLKPPTFELFVKGVDCPVKIGGGGVLIYTFNKTPPFFTRCKHAHLVQG